MRDNQKVFCPLLCQTPSLGSCLVGLNILLRKQQEPNYKLNEKLLSVEI